jgi:D-3-phosphoglycerate dehydrogenase / 2-oxoglutarate reductase
MQILIADKYPEKWIKPLLDEGHAIRNEPQLTTDGLASAMSDAEILVVRSTKIPANVIESASDLKLIVRAGAGTNTIDGAAAAACGVAVCNTPGKNAIAVAELAMGLILSLDRRLPDNVGDLRAGVWNKQKYSKAQGVFGTTLGVVGIGAIGQALMTRAHAFGMRIVIQKKPGRSQSVIDELGRLGATEVDTVEEIAAISDYLSFHLPATAETKGIVNKNLLDQMKPGAAIINTSRGELVDEDALVAAMNEKGIRAGLDVYQNEPGAADTVFTSALANHENLYGTHHIGASTEQSQDAVSEGVIEVISAFVSGDLINCVNGVSR